MKTFTAITAAAAALALGACTAGDDEFARNVEQAHENVAEVLENQAEATGNEAQEERLEDTAGVIREAGEAAAEEVDDRDMTANAQ